jgi:S1-C subfamily serine protease
MNIRTSPLCSALTLALATSVGMAQEHTPATAARPDFRQVVQDGKSKVFPAVVYIKVVQEDYERGEKKSQEITGSGVIVSPDGEVLTNWHVVDKAENVRCLLTDGRGLPAKVLGTDKDTDLALIKIELPKDAGSLPYASFGDSRVLKEGDFVMAMGAPWGLNRSVSIGIISCSRRFLDQISEYSLWLQTDAPINPGNSGGPLVNTDGQIIGINARGMNTADGMGFAIPSETVQVLVPQLRDHSRVDWTWFGLQLQPLHDFNKDTYFEGTEGVIIGETDPDSPARQAGVQARDRILSVNGTALNGVTDEDLPAIRRFLGLLAKKEPATFEILRGTEKLSLKITPREKGDVEGKELACKRWDLTIKEINQFDNPDLYFHRQKGVFVFATKYPGNAANAGLQRNDIVLKIDGKEVSSLAEVEAVHKQTVEKVNEKPRIVFSVLRGGLTRQIVLDFARDYSKE